HVDHRRDVHVRRRMRRLALEDLFGAEMLMRVGHYLSPDDSPGVRFLSVTRPTSSIPACRSWSIASITALYSTRSSALMSTTFSFLFSRNSLSFVTSSFSRTGFAFRYRSLF